MSGEQIFFVASAFVILLGVTAMAQFRWLRDGRAKTTILILSGIAVIASLRIAGLPPSWFEGSKAGFAIALGFLAGAFPGKTGEERSFGQPLLLGLGGTLLAVNVIAFLLRVF